MPGAYAPAGFGQNVLAFGRGVLGARGGPS